MATPHPASSAGHRGPIAPAWAVVLAGLSLAAALIHATAVSEHAGVSPLAELFAAAAILQGAWALLIIARPRRDTLLVGLAANAVFVAVYGVSRLVALPVLGIDAAEAVGFQDLTCALLESAIVVIAGYLLVPRVVVPSFRNLGAVPAAVVLLGVAFVAVPALAAGHGHDHDESAHSHGATTGESAAHVHTAAEVSPVSAKRPARADRLIADTKRELARWKDYRVAEADGFVSMGDGRSGFEHFGNRANARTPETLDPAHPESLVYSVSADGTRTLVSAMYITPPGTSLDDVPDVAGATWHAHSNLCWAGGRIVGVNVNGRCVPGGTSRVTAPMLHVWIVRNPCGPFADLENSSALRGNAPHDGIIARLTGATATTPATNADGTPSCTHTHGH